MRRGLAVLDFVWHLRGSVAVEATGSDALYLDRIEQMLKQQKKPSIERGQIVFEEPLWSNYWDSNSRATAIYDHGEFRIEKDLSGKRLLYDLRSFQAFAFCAVGALMFFFFGLPGGLLNGLMFGGLAFGWVYGMNIGIALIRVPALIKRTVRSD